MSQLQRRITQQQENRTPRGRTRVGTSPAMPPMTMRVWRIEARTVDDLLAGVLQLVGIDALREFLASQSPGERLTTQQAAELLQISRPSVIKLTEQGKIPHVKVGNRRYLERAHVERYRVQMGGRVPEAIPAVHPQVRDSHLRDLVRMSEDQGDFDLEPVEDFQLIER